MPDYLCRNLLLNQCQHICKCVDKLTSRPLLPLIRSCLRQGLCFSILWLQKIRFNYSCTGSNVTYNAACNYGGRNGGPALYNWMEWTTEFTHRPRNMAKGGHISKRLLVVASLCTRMRSNRFAARMIKFQKWLLVFLGPIMNIGIMFEPKRFFYQSRTS